MAAPITPRHMARALLVSAAVLLVAACANKDANGPDNALLGPGGKGGPVTPGTQRDFSVNVGDIGRSSFTLVYDIVQAGSDRLVASGKTVMVSYDYASATSVPLPDATRSLLEQVRITPR